MILAAGFGTRLRPITYTMPKPMVPVRNRPLIDWLVGSLVDAGVNDVIVNLHHHAQQIEEHLRASFPGVHFHFSFEPEILGTGGGLRKVRTLLEEEEDFFLLNGDTLQSAPFDELRRARRERDAIAALTLRHPPAGDRYTAVYAGGGLISGFGKGSGQALMFSGSHCISSTIFDRLPDKPFSDLNSDTYQPLLARGEAKLAAVINDDPMWFDIGTLRRYLNASHALSGGENIIGESTVAGTVRRSVIWDRCYIGRDVTLESCIVTHGVEMRAPMKLQNALICRDDAAIPRDATYRFENGLVIAQI